MAYGSDDDTRIPERLEYVLSGQRTDVTPNRADVVVVICPNGGVDNRTRLREEEPRNETHCRDIASSPMPRSWYGDEEQTQDAPHQVVGVTHDVDDGGGGGKRTRNENGLVIWCPPLDVQAAISTLDLRSGGERTCSQNHRRGVRPGTQRAR